MRRARFRDRSGSVRTGQWTDDGIVFGGRTYPLDEVDVLPPVQPTKLVCTGFNYRGHLEDPHLEEMDLDVPERPVLFLKPPNTLAGHGDTVVLPPLLEQVDFEAEVAVVIGEQCKNVAEEAAMDVVAGFTCLDDLSNHAEQTTDEFLVRVKAFDNAAPLGPCVASPDLVPDDAAIELRVNGETRQSSDLSHLIFSVPEIVAEVTRYMTLEPGDVLATGSPAGTGPLHDGDRVEVEVEGVGTLEHFVEREDGA